MLSAARIHFLTGFFAMLSFAPITPTWSMTWCPAFAAFASALFKASKLFATFEIARIVAFCRVSDLRTFLAHNVPGCVRVSLPEANHDGRNYRYQSGKREKKDKGLGSHGKLGLLGSWFHLCVDVYRKDEKNLLIMTRICFTLYIHSRTPWN